MFGGTKISVENEWSKRKKYYKHWKWIHVCILKMHVLFGYRLRIKHLSAIESLTTDEKSFWKTQYLLLTFCRKCVLYLSSSSKWSTSGSIELNVNWIVDLICSSIFRQQPSIAFCNCFFKYSKKCKKLKFKIFVSIIWVVSTV